MAVRQLSRCCPPALWQHLGKQAGSSTAAAAAEAGWQQQSGQQQPLFRQLLACMRQDAQRHYSQAFQPSRLYPKQRQKSEVLVLWGLIGCNAGMAILAKADQAEVKQLVSQHFKASVEAVSQGRLYTLITSSICHTSIVHCGINVLLLLLYRRTQPLTATEVRRFVWGVQDLGCAGCCLGAAAVLPITHLVWRACLCLGHGVWLHLNVESGHWQ